MSDQSPSSNWEQSTDGPYGQGNTSSLPVYGYPQQSPEPYGHQSIPPGKRRWWPGVKSVPPHVIVALTVALSLVGGIGFLLFGGDDDKAESGRDGSSVAQSETRYRVSFPDVTGEFRRRALDEGPIMPLLGLEDTELGAMSVTEAGYRSIESEQYGVSQTAGNSSVGMMALGFWGEVENPEQRVDELFASQTGSGEGTSFWVEGAPSDFSNEEVVLKCQIGGQEAPDPTLGYALEMTLCVWADDSTVGIVMSVPVPNVPADDDPFDGMTPELEAPQPLPLEQAAEHTRQLRSDSLEEILVAESGPGK